MTEAELLACVLDLAKLYGWRTYHARPAQTARGWRTAVQGSGKGWPDIFMTRRDRAIAVELKRKGGKTTAEQQDWLKALLAAGIAVGIWTPEEWANGAILALLK